GGLLFDLDRLDSVDLVERVLLVVDLLPWWWERDRLLVGVFLLGPELEEDDGDVVLAAAAVRRPDERLRRRLQIVAVAVDLVEDRAVVDHRREAVGAEH